MRLPASRPIRLLVASSFIAGTLAFSPRPAPQEALPDQSATCPETVDAADVMDQDRLRELTTTVGSYAPHRTGDARHNAYTDWIERQLESIPGLEITSTAHVTEDQAYTNTGQFHDGPAAGQPVPLTITDASGATSVVDIAGPVPMAGFTGVEGSSGEIVEVPSGTAMADAEIDGKVVIRPFSFGQIRMALFYAGSNYFHDPDLTMQQRADTRPTGFYERVWMGLQVVNSELQAAQDGGAAGVLFTFDLPREQIEDLWIQSKPFDVPAVFLGSDETAAIHEAMSDAGPLTAALTLLGHRGTNQSRSLTATLPGQSDERIVFQTHTDSLNALQDNGTVGLLAIAEYMANLPLECRSRTLQFEFSAGHRAGLVGAIAVVEKLQQADYDVALVVTMEHLGAKEYMPAPRDEGGVILQETGLEELSGLMVPDSPFMRQLAPQVVIDHDLRRTFVLPGQGLGEARAFVAAGYPTVETIRGPWTQNSPGFGVEVIDFEQMGREILAIGDIVLAVNDVPREVIASPVATVGP